MSRALTPDLEPQDAPRALLVSLEEAGRILAVSRTRVYQLIARDELEAVHVGKLRRITMDSLEELVDRWRDEQGR